MEPKQSPSPSVFHQHVAVDYNTRSPCQSPLNICHNHPCSLPQDSMGARRTIFFPLWAAWDSKKRRLSRQIRKSTPYGREILRSSRGRDFHQDAETAGICITPSFYSKLCQDPEAVSVAQVPRVPIGIQYIIVSSASGPSGRCKK
jgi:hypothetical protein